MAAADDASRPVLFLDFDGVLLPFGDGLTYERFPEPCLAALSHLMVPALAATVARICNARCASVLGGRRLCWQRCGVRASAAGSFGCTEAFARRPVQKNQSSCQRTPSLRVHDCVCTTCVLRSIPLSPCFRRRRTHGSCSPPHGAQSMRHRRGAWPIRPSSPLVRAPKTPNPNPNPNPNQP